MRVGAKITFLHPWKLSGEITKIKEEWVEVVMEDNPTNCPLKYRMMKLEEMEKDGLILVDTMNIKINESRRQSDLST
jgi:hypothetical protein